MLTVLPQQQQRTTARERLTGSHPHTEPRQGASAESSNAIISNQICEVWKIFLIGAVVLPAQIGTATRETYDHIRAGVLCS